MRNVLKMAVSPGRWPDERIPQDGRAFLRLCPAGCLPHAKSAAIALDQDKEFFVHYHSGENITLRLLHYPAWDAGKVVADSSALVHTRITA